jgi:rRNA maturation endonuclease Nob1
MNVPIHRGQTAQVRATMRFSEYNININDLGLTLHEDGPRPGVARVEKKIRLRIRHTCHQCQTAFSRNRVCRTCTHQQCPQCPRDPVRRNRDRSEMITSREGEIIAPTETQSGSIVNDQFGLNTLSIAHRSTERPQVAQGRIEYRCHECETSFVVGTPNFCPNCGHRRCDECAGRLARPILPPEDEPSPSIAGMHRQRVWRKPRMRVRWNCHECQGVFRSGSRTCPGCEHTRCNLCSRQP